MTFYIDEYCEDRATACAFTSDLVRSGALPSSIGSIVYASLQSLEDGYGVRLQLRGHMGDSGSDFTFRVEPFIWRRLQNKVPINSNLSASVQAKPS